MRMFLVVMCDMFLLLYLTALSQMEARPVSELTVQDYIALKESEESVKRTAQSNAAELASMRDDSTKLAAELQEARQRLRAAEEERQRLALAAKSMEATLADSSSRENALKNAESAASKEAERLAREAAEAAAREAKVKTEAEQLKQNANKLEQDLAKLAQAREAEVKKAEASKAEAAAAQAQRIAAQDQAAAALAEAERAKQAALEANRAAAEAERVAKEAQSDSQSAREAAAKAEAGKSQALVSAAQSANDAVQARVLAAKSALQADRAEKEKTKTKERIQAITQKAQTAYSRNVEGKRVAVEGTLVTENVLIGTSKNKLRMSGIPIAFGQEKVVMVPLEHLGISSESEPDDFVSLKLAVGGVQVHKLYISPGKSRIVGIVVPWNLPAAMPIAASDTITSYMPTLIALRNGTEMGFSDSVRDLDPEHYVFQRDRLARTKDGSLEYRQNGFRGTGEFGERLLKGDQIVDLDGNFLGVAIRENIVLPVSGIERWRPVSLDQPAAEVFKKLLE